MKLKDLVSCHFTLKALISLACFNVNILTLQREGERYQNMTKMSEVGVYSFFLYWLHLVEFSLCVEPSSALWWERRKSLFVTSRGYFIKPFSVGLSFLVPPKLY